MAFTVSRYTSLHESLVSAYLWNPPVDDIEIRYPFKDDIDREALKPALVIAGSGLRNGRSTLEYAIEAQGRRLEAGTVPVEIESGWFEARITPSAKYPQAESVSWCVGDGQREALSGTGIR